ncbi:phosphate signaling complex protein PhoU [Ornithinicoccus hortensis]|uniref:Phosphate-specific transport system accessory protein PhoU n=1 Tax=Ornithinicoccus hortensis TaxID=82346 RepID=A0A542YP59_9MICO|nr:phosphate signaling complex protein PhoU [Ornithinicoccus hortensis]TQL49839.1 PhoU-like phosphate uptake regulator [Ornithinicoccus hortensis]
MRKAFDEELQFISDQLVEMTRLAASALTRATQALLDADLELAESVITADEHIDEVRRQLDLRAIDTLARQQPVATDLRILVTSMRMSSDLERMGDLARHIAKLTRLRYPNSVVPPSLRSTFTEMSQVAIRMTAKTGQILATSNPAGAAELHRDDDTIDELHRQVFAELLSENWEHGVEAAIDATLLSRYVERFADHAVSVAERVVYLVTGTYDGEDELDDRLDARTARSASSTAPVRAPRDGELSRR